MDDQEIAHGVAPEPGAEHLWADEPLSVLAARVVRAGLIRRLKGLAPAGAEAHGERKPRFISGNALERGVPPTSLQPPELADFFRNAWPIVRAHTDTDRHRVESLLSVLWQTRVIDGDVVECGSYRCGLGFLFALAMRGWGSAKKVHLYDSFEGLPPLTVQDRGGSDKTYFYEGQFKESRLLDDARAFVEQHQLTGVVVFHQGWFSQTLPAIPAEQRFCFAHIDCDLYAGAHDCWTYLMPHMAQGAGVVVDDYDSPGMYQATRELLSRPDSRYHLYTGALKQAHFFVEAVRAGPDDEDWTPLLANRTYCAYLAQLCAEMILVCAAPRERRDAEMLQSLDLVLGPNQAPAFLERFIAFLYGSR